MAPSEQWIQCQLIVRNLIDQGPSLLVGSVACLYMLQHRRRQKRHSLADRTAVAGHSWLAAVDIDLVGPGRSAVSIFPFNGFNRNANSRT